MELEKLAALAIRKLVTEKEEAIAFYNIDQVVTDEVLNEISKLPNIISVKQLSL